MRREPDIPDRGDGDCCWWCWWCCLGIRLGRVVRCRGYLLQGNRRNRNPLADGASVLPIPDKQEIVAAAGNHGLAVPGGDADFVHEGSVAETIPLDDMRLGRGAGDADVLVAIGGDEIGAG